MRRLLVGVADDQSVIHEILDEYVQNREDIELIHFYDTIDVIDYLENGDFLDMLFLDIAFEGSRSGTEALPDIKEAAPDLPVIFLTGNDKENPDVDYMISHKIAYDYMEKPVSQKVFLNKIRSLSNVVEDLGSLKDEIENNMKALEEIEEEYSKQYMQKSAELNALYSDIALDKENLERRRQELDLEINELASNVLPEKIKDMMRKTYYNLEFRDKVIIELLGKNYDSRIFDLLSKVNNNLPLGPGENVQPFPEFKIPDLYEYRISQKARLFIQRRKNTKMLVYDVDYNHDKH